MNIGIIGLGKMGKNHLRVYSEMRGIDEIFVYDTSSEVLRHLRDKYNVKICDSLDDLLRKVEAVSICVPTKYHYIISKKAIDANLNCLIEKPFTSNLEEGLELMKFAKNKKDLILGVGHIERFNPIVNEIKKILIRPRYIDIKRHNPASSRIIDTPVVADLMIHDIDIVWNLFFKDEKYELYSLGNSDIQKVVAKFGDCIISLSASRNACKKERSIYVECDDYTIDGDFMRQEIYIYQRPEKYRMNDVKYAQENVIEKLTIGKVEPLREELKVFIDCIRTKKSFPVTLEQAVKNLEIIENISKICL